jgi:hypothetical protein
MAPGLGTAFDAPIAAALAVDPQARPAPLELAERLTDALGEPRPRAGAAAAAVVPLVATADPAPVDPTAATQADIRPDAAVHVPGASGARFGGPGPAIAALSVIGLLVLALLALSSLLDGRDGNPAAGPTSSATATPLATPTPTPSSTPPPTPSPTRAPGSAAEAYAVLDRVDAAIEDLADEDDIRDRDLDALRRRAGDVRNALEAGDYDGALDRTARLDDEVDRVDDRVQGDAMDEVKDAVSQLDEAIPAG